MSHTDPSIEYALCCFVHVILQTCEQALLLNYLILISVLVFKSSSSEKPLNFFTSFSPLEYEIENYFPCPKKLLNPSNV